MDSHGIQQRYNRRGYPINPESRGIARTSRRAQNDVLSTVGFCVGIHEDGSPVDTSLTLAKASKHEKERIEFVRKENEAGLLLGAASHGLMFFSVWWILSLRLRLQVKISRLLPIEGSGRLIRLALDVLLLFRVPLDSDR